MRTVLLASIISLAMADPSLAQGAPLAPEACKALLSSLFDRSAQSHEVGEPIPGMALTFGGLTRATMPEAEEKAFVCAQSSGSRLSFVQIRNRFNAIHSTLLVSAASRQLQDQAAADKAEREQQRVHAQNEYEETVKAQRLFNELSTLRYQVSGYEKCEYVRKLSSQQSARVKEIDSECPTCATLVAQIRQAEAKADACDAVIAKRRDDAERAAAAQKERERTLQAAMDRHPACVGLEQAKQDFGKNKNKELEDIALLSNAGALDDVCPRYDVLLKQTETLRAKMVSCALALRADADHGLQSKSTALLLDASALNSGKALIVQARGQTGCNS